MFSSSARELLGEGGEQRAQRLALIGVAQAVDRRQQSIEAIGGQRVHGISSRRSNGAGSSVSSSAGERHAVRAPACARRAAAPGAKRDLRRRATAAVEQRRGRPPRRRARACGDGDHVRLLHRLRRDRARVEGEMRAQAASTAASTAFAVERRIALHLDADAERARAAAASRLHGDVRVAARPASASSRLVHTGLASVSDCAVLAGDGDDDGRAAAQLQHRACALAMPRRRARSPRSRAARPRGRACAWSAACCARAALGGLADRCRPRRRAGWLTLFRPSGRVDELGQACRLATLPAAPRPLR